MAIDFNGTTFTGTNANHQVNFNGVTMCTVVDNDCNIKFDHQTAKLTGAGGWQCICPYDSNVRNNCFNIWCYNSSIGCWWKCRTFRGYYNLYCMNTDTLNNACICVCYQHSYAFNGARCQCVTPGICRCLVFSSAVSFPTCCGISSMQLGSPSGYDICACWRQRCLSLYGSLGCNGNFLWWQPGWCTCPISCVRYKISCGANINQYITVGCNFSWNNCTMVILQCDICRYSSFITAAQMNAVRNCAANFYVSGNISCIPSQLVPDMNFWDCVWRNNCTCVCTGYEAWYNMCRNHNVTRSNGDMYRSTSMGWGTCPRGNGWSYFSDSGVEHCVGV